jgi:RNA polymerase sigma-70 factor (ECF subfamily)
MQTTTCPSPRETNCSTDNRTWDRAVVATGGGHDASSGAGEAGAAARPPSAGIEPMIERARKRDMQAIGALYEHFSPEVFRYLYRQTGDRELTADLTGQVFVRVIEAIDGGHAWRQSFPGWLHRIAQNLLIDHVRATRRRPQCALSEEIATTGENGMDEEVDRQLVAREIWQAVGELKPEHAQVLFLRFAGDLSHAEVGRRFGMSEVAVKVTQHRAIRNLRTRLADQTVTPLQAQWLARRGPTRSLRGGVCPTAGTEPCTDC